MQIQWHGRNGPHGKIPDHSMLKIGLASAAKASLGLDLVLKPGVNDGVSPEHWALALKNPVVRHYVEVGYLVPLDAESLARFPAVEAKRLVSECIDEKLLVKWRNGEQRAEVLAAIDKQLDGMRPRSAEPKGVKK